jgi:hypothetical protein
MSIDWHRKTSAEGVGVIASVLLESRRAGALESTLEAKTIPEAERIERLGEALAKTKPTVPEGEHEELKKHVLAGATSGLAKLNQGQSGVDYTLGELVGLESVILTNGERPSLVVRNGFIDLEAPDIGRWDQHLGRAHNEIRRVIASVGRVNVPVKPWFAGTCFVIAEGFVLTNRHVLEEIATQTASGAWALKWPDATSVDFLGEDEMVPTAATKFRVTGVAFAGPDPINRKINFEKLDMAILRIDVGSDADHPFPNPVTFETDTTKPKADRDLYVVGFPGEPRVWEFGGRPPPGYESAQVISTIFNTRFGVKRLAPGIVKLGPGEVKGDPKRWICAHDASTLGGNSGSCVADLSGDGSRIVALHFAGFNRDQNWAHVAAQLHEQLSTYSATFVP